VRLGCSQARAQGVALWGLAQRMCHVIAALASAAWKHHSDVNPSAVSLAGAITTARLARPKTTMPPAGSPSGEKHPPAT